jgi:hypothetical protein
MTLAPLKLKCNTTDCPNDLHFFRKKPREKGDAAFGPCNECGQERIDWEQVHARDIRDAAATIQQLQYEWIRHHYWHEPIDQRAINCALKKGRPGLKEKVHRRLLSSIGGATPFRDGAQTPFGGPDPVTYAQHATASCCRKCVEEWWNVPRGRELTTEELEYLSELAMFYLEAQIPGLTDEPQKIPPLRRKNHDGD